MAKHENDVLYVLAATYPDAEAAVVDYEAVKELYREIRSSHDFDAAVIAKDVTGKVHIIKKHEQPTRHGAAVGLGWGLAVGVVAAIFPPVGIGVVTAGAGGAAIGAVTGHVTGGMSRSDLKELGDTLDAGEAGLIAVYATDLADQIEATIKAANRALTKETNMAAEELASELRTAEQSAPSARPAGSTTT